VGDQPFETSRFQTNMATFHESQEAKPEKPAARRARSILRAVHMKSLRESRKSASAALMWLATVRLEIPKTSPASR
jgi:hypothetical protein